MAIAARDLILDNHGREGIVLREEPFPGRAWLGGQADPRLAQIGKEERWLGVLPLTGGLIIAPESLCKRLRAADRADVLHAVENANEAGVRYLVALFPELVTEIIGHP